MSRLTYRQFCQLKLARSTAHALCLESARMLAGGAPVLFVGLLLDSAAIQLVQSAPLVWRWS